VTTEPGIRLRSHFSELPVQPERIALLGMVDIDTCAHKAFLNSVAVTSSREYLLPDDRGAWTILSDDGAKRITGSFPQHTRPVESDVQSLIAIGELVKNSLNRAWQELEEIAPSRSDNHI
jgi:hypothetical protein